MIAKEQMIPLLLDACPSFQTIWHEHENDHDEPLLYLAIGDFARHRTGNNHRRHRLHLVGHG